ncbi:phosphoribosyltransferase [Candidatus Nitrosocosmicus arcticus]|uniref:Putative phosphoribosyl transferase n=1 Tax=Candidatus Nitrosocosmicus arcticus TaxID=2035267 RepID=A0A557SUS6_9ARCH|nr:phosphoribosyltransferase family protein [Candidatus Nitrosocosmicus arcticus]TVP40364.1 putative phosphoribosyl transferase [Candidatus Nitrosocosmicus arcticus]
MIFSKIFRNIQIKFKDRTAAAVALSEILKGTIKRDDRKDTLVLAIPRAGIITADIVSKKLSIPNFGIVIPRKLTDPDNKEQAIGAVIDDGFTFIQHDLVKDFHITPEYLKKEISFQIQEINLRKRKYDLNLQSSVLPEKIKKYKIILLVDDGIATGATMMVTAKWIGQFVKNPTINRKRVIIAVPVAPKNITEHIKKECSVEVETVFHPLQIKFHSVEQYHQNFEQVTDERVIQIIKGRSMD